MKRFKIVILSIAVLAALICRWVFAAPADDQQVISDLERKVAVMTDADELMKYYESGDDVVLYNFVGPPREFVGGKAIHDQFDEFSGYTNVKVDFLELQVINDGKLALARSVQHITSKGPDGKPFDGIFRNTDVWRKTNSQWKLIHTHLSFPVDMKTGKADKASKM